MDIFGDVLLKMCKRNDQFMNITNIIPMTRFHALRAPQMTIKAFLKRIEENCCCSEQCFVLALIYIDRLVRNRRYFQVNSLSIHRVIITSIMIGAKFLDEPVISNAYFAQVGCISCKELNMLEIDFLFGINFNLDVDINLYNTYIRRLLPDIQPEEEKDGGIVYSGNKTILGGPQNDQIELDEAAPVPPSDTHCPAPLESKVDIGQKPEAATSNQ